MASQPSRAAAYRAVVLSALLVVLHRSDGGSVIVNAEQITSLRSPAGKLGKLAPSGHCIVGMTDAKFIAVLEACAAIKKQIESPR